MPYWNKYENDMITVGSTDACNCVQTLTVDASERVRYSFMSVVIALFWFMAADFLIS